MRIVEGSVKNLNVLEEPTDHLLGKAEVVYGDDFSIFDYGKMPDMIPGKGRSLCDMSCFNFEILGVPSHYAGRTSSTSFYIRLARVLRGEIPPKEEVYLVPVEFLFRNSLPPGSSLLDRLRSGKIPLSAVGLDHMPEEWEELPKPVYDFTTKLERFDRPIDESDLVRYGLTLEDIRTINSYTIRVNQFLTRHADTLGLKHHDGKAEFIIGDGRRIMLADVVGTLDENRLSYHRVHLSKEILRQWYKKKEPEWYKTFTEWKTKVAENPDLPKPIAPRAPGELIRWVSDVYQTTAKVWIGERETSLLDSIVEEGQKLEGELFV